MGTGIFEAEKRRALERLHNAGADDDIAELIELLNGFDDYFTTSSCSGRVILICIPEIGQRKKLSSLRNGIANRESEATTEPCNRVGLQV